MLCFSRMSVHPVPSTSLAVAALLIQLLRRYTLTVRWIIWCWSLLTQGCTVCFKYNHRIDRRFPLIKTLVHPVLKGFSWHVSVFIQTRHQIDRWCPHSDCRIIRCYCLRFFFSATHPTLLENGLSVHLTVPRFSTSVPTRSTIASTVALTLAILVPSVHPTACFLFFSLLSLACDILASLGPRNVYKDMLNNMVSPIDHVVMNHQNQTRTNGKRHHDRYNLPFFGDL
jgi:hypothetical protein